MAQSNPYSPKTMSYTIRIINRQRRLSLDRGGVESLAGWVLGREGRREGEVSLVFLNDAGIRELNRRYLGRDYPTDVLSFPQNEGPAVPLHPWFLGDVVLSTGRVVRQAPDHGQSAEDELALCLIHGVLHLLGYRDRPAGCRRKMSRREEQLLRAWKRKKRWSLIN
ncbi:MAG: rRNA maturation RNase YbeY [PVC group bacterium]